MPGTTPDASRPLNRRGPPAGSRIGRLGLVQYGRILAVISRKPCTHRDVAKAIGRGEQTMREILWRMVHLGEAHVVGWAPSDSLRGQQQAVFAGGPGESLPYPRQLCRAAPGSTLARSNPKPELIAFCSLIRELRQGVTRQELHEDTGVAMMRIGILLKSLRVAGMVHRCGWHRESQIGGKPAEVLKFGPGRDAPRPPAMTVAEKNRRHRDRRSQRIAGERIVAALQGRGRITANGIQRYDQLGATA